MTRLWIGCHDFEACPATGHPDSPAIVLEATTNGLRRGMNGLLATPGSVSLVAAHWRGGSVALDRPVPFEPGGMTGPQRRLRSQMRTALGEKLRERWLPGLEPVVYAMETRHGLQFHLASETTDRETLALRFAEPLPKRVIGGFDDYRACAADVAAELDLRSTLFNTRWNYSQWRSDMELERKYTFRAMPDTWMLVTDLYHELRSGAVPGFFPEPHMGFQVFDYENHIFDVSAPPDEAGYISFIPQVDGPVTVKRKWFRENAELRRESLWPNESIPVDSFPEAARRRVDGVVEQLPAFRRKRFDVNYESLETGHVFGVYFDICATVDSPREHRFGQVEVEYCRSRTAFALADVTPEFEWLCAHVERFLGDRDVKFQHDLFSKLDFAREARGLAAAE